MDPKFTKKSNNPQAKTDFIGNVFGKVVIAGVPPQIKPPLGADVILEFAHKIRKAVLGNDIDKAKKLAEVANFLEDEFPAAKAYLNELYPKGLI